ncbi:MAG: hypothetical protein AABZ70_04330, partial [candidate division NC10 bacterium]
MSGPPPGSAASAALGPDPGDPVNDGYAPGARCRQGGITKAGNTHARRAPVEGAWAYRYPAKIS